MGYLVDKKISFYGTRRFVKNLLSTLNLLFKSSPKYTIIIILISILSGIIVPLQTVVWKYLIDAIVEALETDYYIMVIVFLLFHLLLNLGTYVFEKLSRFSISMESNFVNIYVTNIVYDKIIDLDMEKFDSPKIYNTIQKATNESASRIMSILETFIKFFESIIMFFGVIIIFIKFNISFIFLCLISCVPTFFLNMKMALKQYHIYNNRIEKLRYINFLKNFFVKYENIKELKIYRLGNFFKEMILKEYEKFLKEDKNIKKKFLRKNILTDVFRNFITYFLYLVIIIKVISQKRTIGDVTLYITSITNFQVSVSVLLNAIESFYEDGLYIDELISFIIKKVEKENNPVKKKVEIKTIELQHLYFKYPENDNFVLKDVNLFLDIHKLYSIVGINGAGKTTLIKLILGLYKPTKGKILINGEDINEIDIEDYYQNFGTVFQDFVKYPLSIGKNIMVGNIESIDNIEIATMAAKSTGADLFINSLPKTYDTLLLKEWTDAVDLSMGQWQKIALSRAFCNKRNRMVILDEPTASIDAKTEYQIFQNFKNLMGTKGCILISHRLSNVKIVDKIIVLKDGKIVEEGNHKQLMSIADGDYRKLYLMQSEGYVVEKLSLEEIENADRGK